MSPKPGALTQTTLSPPRSLFTMKPASASLSTSSAITTSGFVCPRQHPASPYTSSRTPHTTRARSNTLPPSRAHHRSLCASASASLAVPLLSLPSSLPLSLARSAQASALQTSRVRGWEAACAGRHAGLKANTPPLLLLAPLALTHSRSRQECVRGVVHRVVEVQRSVAMREHPSA